MNKEFIGAMPKLGFGLMRLPQKDGEIDLPQTCEMVDMFMGKGFKYFDTAYAYGDGASERAIKAALVDRYPRDSYYLATKLPSSDDVKTEEEAQKMFYVSLERTGAGYFDFFLLHNLGEQRTKFFDKFHMWDFIQEKKREGLIRYAGFSFHDKGAVLDEILNAHPEVDFVQLQINYADWENPSVESRKCWEVARAHGKPIVVMEPVKGGNLANPPEEIRELFQTVNPDASPSSWAIRFVASHEGILTVLSGMSNIEQMEDNLSYMSDFKPLSDAEYKAIGQARDAFARMPIVSCTACEYCMKGCPMSVAIPGAFQAYNMYVQFSLMDSALGKYNWNTTGHGLNKASACIECGCCEKICPQHIKIRDELKKVAKVFD